MPPYDGEKLNRIEELKQKIASKNYQMRIEHQDSFVKRVERQVPDSWSDEGKRFSSQERFFMRTSIFKKFFIFSIIFFILATGYAAYMFLAGGNTVSGDNIDISVVGNTFTAGGDELPLQIGITNKNNTALDLVDLVMEYPKGSSGDLAQKTERTRQSLGSIPAGVVRTENTKVVLFGEQGSIIPIKIDIEYRVEGSNAIFVKEKIFEVTINSTPINLSITAPDDASPNQDISLNINASLNATKTSPKMLLRVDYPIGFQFAKAVPAPSFGNNIFDLGDLAPGAQKNIVITGKMLDVSNGEQKTFRVSSGSRSDADKAVIGVIFNSIEHVVMIQKPFLEAKLSINGATNSEYAIDSKSSVHGQIAWVNNLDTKVDDIEIRAKISGNAVDRKTINADQGFYNSSEDIIIWDKSSINKLAEANPGDSGIVTFSVYPLPLFSANSALPDSPLMNIEVSIAGKQAVEGSDTKNIQNSDSAVVRIISDVGLAAKALYYSGPFQNTGSIPPKVEKETTYTVVWNLSNTANSISKGVVKSTLPAWMRFVGPVSPPSEDLNYNASAREITWNVGSIPKGAGITTSAKEVDFQIAINPSLSQLNTTPTIINDAVLTGHDDFANVDIRVTKNSLTTRLSNDPAFPANGDRVTQ